MTPPRRSTREEVLAFIRAYPGVHLRELERELGISSALAHYHAKALERDGLIVSAAIRGYLRLYPRGDEGQVAGLSPEEAKLLAILREEVPLHMVLVLLEEGPMAQSDLATKLGVVKSTMSYHVDKLTRLGLLARETAPDGQRRVRLAEPARTRRLLRRFEPTRGATERFRRLWEDFYG